MNLEKKENNTAILLPLVVLLLGLAAVFYCYHKPLSDFGNFYYGAAFMQKNDYRLVYDVHRFNEAVAIAGGKDLFLNHTTSPPQTPLFYLPLSYVDDPFLAKCIFNSLGVCCFAFMLFRILRFYPPLSLPRSVLFMIIMAYPFYQNIVFGQTYLFIASLIIAAWLSYLKGRSFLSGFWLAFAVVLKITPAVFLIYFIVRRSWKTVFSCLLCCGLITCAGIVFYGSDVFEMYFFHHLPRIMDGYINDPYSPGYHGVLVLLRHLGQYDAVLNPFPPFHFSEQFITLINLLVLLPFLAVVLLRVSINRPAETTGVVLLLLFMCLGSGYFSMYSLVVFSPFFILQRNGAAPITQAVLVVVICLFPWQLPDTVPVFFQHYKLYALMLLFILVATRSERSGRMSVVSASLLFVFVVAQVVKLFVPGGGPKYSYYRKDILQHYVSDYEINGNELKLTVYSKKGRESILIQLPSSSGCELPVPKRSEYIGKGHILYKNILCRNDSILFLSDAGRGTGLYHIYSVPKSKFPLNELK